MSEQLSANSTALRENCWWQPLLSLDAKYSVMYMRRRNQLFRELGQKEGNTVRKSYTKIRALILNRRYGHLLEGNTKWKLREDNIRELIPESHFDQLMHNIDIGDKIDNEKMELCDTGELNEQCAFTGMHHIFDHHKSAVTRVHFANNDKSLLACCSLDGTLSICQLTPTPATVLYILRGHTNGISDFEWSLSNDLIVSCSLDCSVRLWDTASGACLREIRDPTFSPVLAAAFQPINNNMIVIGNFKGYIHVINVSTGILVKCGSLRTNTGCSVQCLCFDSSGRVLWIGDSRGFVSSFLFELPTGRLMRLTKSLLSAEASITSVFVKTTSYGEMKNSYLLVNRYPNSVLVFSIDQEMRLNLLNTLKIKHQNRCSMIRSVFCALPTRKEGICVVSGSEDSDVYLFTDFECNKNKFRNPQVSKLQGHSAPVLDVCFNFDESLLATSDILGNVVVWKKDKLE
ncbi:hypothetical protein B4U80_06858 [Leptotrombidium deliense]|uniref:WD repeat-containing protein 13-like protein n=1 Tax=Leptotrombidium deliense TaxID=299467 RepID=A0A443SMJ7_9ACAR|nr:hypothetical protein B4U80_06858 [Leptotrombidium deliense]